MVKTSSTFVGRERELKILDNKWRNTLKGKGSVVLIAGEAGIGKSELINKFTKNINQKYKDKQLTIHSHCSSVTGDVATFHPFYQLFENIYKEKDEDKNKKIVWEIIEDLAPDIPVVGTAISFSVKIKKWYRIIKGKNPLEKKEISQDKFFFEYSKALQHASAVIPLILIIEDLQYIDNSSINLLHYLSKEIKNYQILIICAYRPEETKILESGKPHPLGVILPKIKCYKNVREIELDFLSLKDIINYTSKVCPNHDFPKKFFDLIYDKTEGNSLFVVEMIKLFKQRKIIVHEEGKWSLVKDIKKIPIPKHVEAIIEMLFENIEKPDKELHKKASVDGEKFRSKVLSELMSMDEYELLNKLEEVEDKYALIYEIEDGSLEDGDYKFKHSLIHQNIYYSQLSEKQRELLHKNIGEILEDKLGNRLEKITNILAYHFEKGCEYEKALQYYSKAAESAEETNSFVEALLLYDKVYSIIVRNNIGTIEWKVDILNKMAAINQILGRGKMARKKLEECLKLNEKIDDDLIKASNFTNLGITYYYVGKFNKSLNELKKAQKIFESKEDEIKKDKQNYETFGICLNYLGIIHRDRRKFRESEEFHEKAKKIGQDIKSKRLEAHANANIGAIYLHKKEFSKVISYWERSLELSKEKGDIPWIVHYTIDVGYMHFLERNYSEAVDNLEEGVRDAKENHFKDNYARGIMNLGSVWFAENELKKSENYYKEALKKANDENIFKLVWRLQHNIGNIYRKNGEYKKAYEYYLSSIKYLEREVSKLKKEKDKEGFLKHRLDPFRSMILLSQEKKNENMALKYAKTLGFDMLTDYLERRRQGVNLIEEEKNNPNFFHGYYIATE